MTCTGERHAQISSLLAGQYSSCQPPLYIFCMGGDSWHRGQSPEKEQVCIVRELLVPALLLDAQVTAVPWSALSASANIPGYVHCLHPCFSCPYMMHCMWAVPEENSETSAQW